MDSYAVNKRHLKCPNLCVRECVSVLAIHSQALALQLLHPVGKKHLDLK